MLLLAAVIAVALLAYEPAAPKQADTPKQPESACGTYRNDKTVTINGSAFKSEVAKTDAERRQGLSGRPCIEPNRAMLFAFDHPGQYAIWMKDMRFPIDILWINSDHKVVGQEVDVSPSTYPDRFVNKDKPALYVLELKANRTKELNVGLGTAVSF